MTDEQFNQLLESIRRLEIESSAAKQHRQDQQANIERFWNKDWRDLVGKIDNIATDQGHMEIRLRNLEVLLAHTPERISKIEGKCEAMEKRQQSMAIAVITIGVISLGDVGSKLAAFL